MITSMETNSNITIADSSALISLSIITDTNHSAAKKILENVSSLDYTIIIPAEIFSETVNILGKKFGHKKSVESIELFLGSSLFIVIPTTDTTRRDALYSYMNHSSGVSYTDCLVMAVADFHNTTSVFGFDEIFKRNGYSLPTFSSKT